MAFNIVGVIDDKSRNREHERKITNVIQITVLGTKPHAKQQINQVETTLNSWNFTDCRLNNIERIKSKANHAMIRIEVVAFNANVDCRIANFWANL